jgi:hypothetical protein
MSITTAEGSMTGTAVHVQGNLYGYELSDGTSGGFMVDDSGRHAGFVDRQFYFGVVEKGATNLPRYDALDLVGSWSGSTVELSGPELELVRTYSSSATVSSAYAFVGSNAAHGVFAGSFEDYSADYGRFRGRASLPDDSLMNVAIFLSADKSFAAGYACRAYGRFPDECTFTGWHK